MTICEQLTERFPIRKTAAQKKAFRQWVMGEISRMGYRARVEENAGILVSVIFRLCNPTAKPQFILQISPRSP